ncbi:hypothetical protein [Archangium sp.]|nr:hypothetical protein [Archangium sp.]HYO52877.1 hypothetical protein [Archangium sp.]
MTMTSAFTRYADDLCFSKGSFRAGARGSRTTKHAPRSTVSSSSNEPP